MDTHEPMQVPSDNWVEQDPYAAHLVSRNLRIHKAPLSAFPVGILTNTAQKRDLRLINPASRAIRAQEVHELTCTTEERDLGDVVHDVGYLAFAVFPESGVVARGDLVTANENHFGIVLGFCEIHAPNHINIIIRVNELTTGIEQNWGLETVLKFSRPFDENLNGSKQPEQKE